MHQFLDYNTIPRPVILTYDEADKVLTGQVKSFFQRGTRDAELMGRGTGLYGYKHIFVNVPVTAVPVVKPAVRSWSWPGWKTDRTAVGVCAHECGHYVEHALQSDKRISFANQGRAWRALLQQAPHKPVSGYEQHRPPSEAWAETMRLFILNPDLLRLAIPKRYAFLTQQCGLKALPALLRKGWRSVLSNDNYVDAGCKWIGV